MAKRVGELRVQVDRWPVRDGASPYVLTIICVGGFDARPDKKAIMQMLVDARISVSEVEE